MKYLNNYNYDQMKQDIRDMWNLEYWEVCKLAVTEDFIV
jgi:hypothetical protein